MIRTKGTERDKSHNFGHESFWQVGLMWNKDNRKDHIENRIFYFLIRYKKTQQKSKINVPQFLRCMYVCVCVCLLDLYLSRRLTYGTENVTTISVNTHLDAETIIL